MIPLEKEFLRLCDLGNLIPVYREILADTETPVSAYYKLAAKSRFSFLLESVEGEEKVARYSFLASDPQLVIRTKNQKAEILRFNKRKKTIKSTNLNGSPLKLLKNLLKDYKLVEVAGLPRFCGGFVGFLNYDVVRFFEKLPNLTKDDLKIPDLYMMMTHDLVIFDHRNHKIKIVQCVHIPQGASNKVKIKSYRQAVAKIDRVVQQLNKPMSLPASKTLSKGKVKIRSNFRQKDFERIVKLGKEYIQKGDIIQVVLSQRFEVDLKSNPFYIYRSLRALNPSPYMYFLKYNDLHIVGSSPEMLVRCEEGVVETRPIAGTRPRGKTESDDARLAKELLNDPKEKAEHIMLVDLGRNDLGRVCQQGSVRVKDFMIIEKYSHVMHIVSSVQGKLSGDKDSLDVLEASFPAGTVSGAPKIRAMEIIEELEHVSRGPYAGCVGYISFSGNLDTCITIRTIVVKGKKAYIQAGAGIVADSVPETEFHETMNKARAQIKSIEQSIN